MSRLWAMPNKWTFQVKPIMALIQRTGRHFVGIDIGQEYCDVAERRVAEELQQLTLAI